MPILSNFPGGAGSGSGGLTLEGCLGITTQVFFWESLCEVD